MAYLHKNDIDYYKVNLNGAIAPTTSEAPILLLPPEIPAIPAITAGNAQLTVTWAGAEDAEAYEVWMGTSNNSGSAEKYGEDVTGTAAVITGLTNGTTYYVWVRAKNSAGTRGFSLGISSKPIGAMGAVIVTPGNNQLSLSWNSVAGADQYLVFYSPPQPCPKQAGTR
jgi:predicted phage tail protein